MTSPDLTLRLPLQDVHELQQVLDDAVEHLSQGRLTHHVLYDLHYNAARLELALEKAHMPRRDSKEPPR